MGDPTPAEIPLISRLLTGLLIVSQVFACGGSSRGGVADGPVAGSASDHGGAGGADKTGGAGVVAGGGLPGSAGSPPASGSAGSSGGSAVLGGTGGMGSTAGAGGAGGADGEPSKIILFDGSEESFRGWISPRGLGFNPWKLNDDGTMTVAPAQGDIQSKHTFRNVFVHLEYRIPYVSAPAGDRLGRCNSGVLLNGSYELQIIDLNSLGLEPADHVCGAVYGVRSPLEVACHDQEVWNTYEIEFQAPICDQDSKISTPARFIEVKLNGTLIHENVDVLMPTLSGHSESCQRQGLLLQNWASIVPASFRNIWAIARD